jgi:hypothetical protein
LPRQVGQTPTSTRARDDLPEPLGPITPTPEPAARAKLTSWTRNTRPPGGPAPAASTASSPCGAGRRIASGSAAWAASISPSRRQPWRAPTKPFQCEMASSTGASARETRIEEAIMMPPVASPPMTR